MNNLFSNNIKEYKPIFFHFLDGYLKENCGNTFSDTFDFFKKFGINLMKRKNITIGYPFKENTNYVLKYYNFEDSLEGEIIFNHTNHQSNKFITIKTKSREINGTVEDLHNVFLKILNYCIIQIGDESHAISLLIIRKENTLELLIINSGEGIDSTTSKDINDITYFVPYKLNIICDDITNPNKLSHGINSILSMSFFQLLYKDINTLHENIEFVNNTSFNRIFNETMYLLKYILQYCSNLSSIKAGTSTLGSISQTKQIELFLKKNTNNINIYYTERNDSISNVYMYLVDKKPFLISELFYNIISRINPQSLFYNVPEKSGFKNINLTNINKITTLSHEVKNKMIFHFIDDGIYIISQKNGSCTWYSIYWAILFYYYFNNDTEGYINFINDTNEYFRSIINEIFSRRNFYYEIQTSDFVLMKKTYAKLCDIGLFENKNKLLEDISEILFLKNFTCDLMETLSNDTLENNITNSFTNFTYVDKDFITQSNDEFINSTLDNFVHTVLYQMKKLLDQNIMDPIKLTNTSVLFYYMIFDAQKTKGNIFKNSIKNINLNDILTNISKICNTITIKKQKEEITKIYHKFELDYKKKLNYYLNKLSQSYDKEFDCYNYKYYHIALLFTNSDIESINFSLFLNRCVLSTEILKIFYKIIRLIQNDNEKIGNIIQEINSKISFIFNTKNFIPINIKNVREFLEHINFKDNEEININTRYLNKFDELNIQSMPNIIIQKNLKTWDDFVNIKDFYYSNPEYLYSSLNNQIYISDDLFIKYHLNDIVNTVHRTSLIRFFSEKFWLKRHKTNIELINILFNLHLLIYKTNCTVNNEILDKKTDNYNNYNLFQYKTSDKTIYQFYDEMIQISDGKTLNVFCDFICEHYTEFTIGKFDDIVKKIKKIYPDTQPHNYMIRFENKTFNMLSNDNSALIFPLLNFFKSGSDNPIVFYNKKSNDIELVIVVLNYVIKISGKIVSQIRINYKNSDAYIFSIKEIFINKNNVVNISNINYPFKYTIPLTCNNLIFKNGNTFNIINFINNTVNDEKYNLFGTNNISSGILIFTINENTMLYPKIVSADSLINFGKLCENYHVRPLNIIFTKIQKPSNGYCVNDALAKLFKFDKTKFLTHIIDPKQIDKMVLMNLIPESDDVTKIHTIFSKKKNNEIDMLSKIINLLNLSVSNSFDKILEKIEFCKIVENNKLETIEQLKCLKNQIDYNINNDFVYYENCDLNELFNEFSTHINFMLKIKISNIVGILLDLIDDEDSFCSQLKILKVMTQNRKNNLLYNFELFFETLTGNELLDEQYERYSNIVNNFLSQDVYPNKLKEYSSNTYNIINYSQSGGNIYPLHHFMMGKGKSSIMTPLLSLYFILIHKKNVFAIMPEHLVRDAISYINQYTYICDVENSMSILSDSEIKKDFLDGQFSNEIINSKRIFIIDEFDSLIDPTKSNFNSVRYKTIEVYKIFKFLYPIVKSLKINPLEPIKFNKSELNIFDLNEESASTIVSDVTEILESLNSNTLIENINWGIDIERYYAIPYLSKDKPIQNSSFSSVILTIFLTLYYYICIKNYEVSDIIINFIIEKNLFIEIFNMKQPNENILQIIKENIKANDNIKTRLFDIFFNELFKTIMLPSEQFNTSFVDILNIDSIYKIGYSGTINLTLPPVPRLDNKFRDIQADNDEYINVSYALLKAKTFIINKSTINFTNNIVSDYIKKLEIMRIDISENYHAFIDQDGIFKNEVNRYVAVNFSSYFKLKGIKRDIIYITEQDSKMVLGSDGQEIEYNGSIKYHNPFIYYSQSHVIGVDIKQDYYPKLKGLVTIGTKSIYTNVAQAVFRLRKLNLGHEIDILYIVHKLTPESDYPSNSLDVLNMIKENEEKQKNNKQDLLIYQTIKSEIRKKRNKSLFSNNYLEKIKYYYFEPFPSKIYDYYEGIFSREEFNDKSLKGLFDQINTHDKLKKLVFNVNSNSIEIIQTKETEIAKARSIEQVVDQSQEIKIPQINYDYIGYIFVNINKPDIFNRITIPINKIISCVPNISVQTNGTGFFKNNSGYAFILIEEVSKLLLVPGYMVPFFYEKHIILGSIHLNLINLNKSNEYNEKKDLIDCFKNNDFFIYLENGIEYKELNQLTNLFISGIILSQYKFLLPNQTDFLNNKFNQNNQFNRQLEKNILDYFNDWFKKEYPSKIVITPNTDTEINLDPFYKTNDEIKFEKLQNEKCEKNKKNYMDNIKLQNEKCEKNKKTYMDNLKSIKKSAQRKVLEEQKKVLEEQQKILEEQQKICETNKKDFDEFVICTKNKKTYNERDDIDLCKKYKIEYEPEFTRLNLMRIHILEEQIKSLTKSKNEYSQKSNDYNKKLNEKITELKELNKSKSQKNKKLNKQAIENEMDKLNKDITKIDNKIKKYDSNVKNLTNDIENLENQIAQINQMQIIEN